MGSRDQEYYRRRIADESAAAVNASCAVARAAHLDLVERYSAKLRLIELLSAESPTAEPLRAAAPAPRPARQTADRTATG